jgi:hypothetical protein
MVPLLGHTLPPEERKGGRALRVLLILLGLGALAALGFLGYTLIRDRGASATDSVSADAAAVAVADSMDASAGQTPAPDATGAVVATASDAGAAKPDTADATPVEPSSKLEIVSDPKRAKVYLDGTLVGKTPIELDPTSDSHRLAIVKDGYKLHLSDVAGKGRVEVKLEEVTPTGGPAGIKVRCKVKDRYYVFVDTYDVGQLCPTERIEVEKGEHVVEIYDPVTDSRRQFRVEVKETRNSLRVRVD